MNGIGIARFFHSLSFFIFLTAMSLPCSAVENVSSVSSIVAKTERRLEGGEPFSSIFGVAADNVQDGEPYILWLKPEAWPASENFPDAEKYISFIGFVYLRAPFFRVSHVAIAYPDEAKFIPGVLSTKVVEWKRGPGGRANILVERERALPLFLSGFKDKRYRSWYNLTREKGKMLLIRSRLAKPENGKPKKSLLKDMKGFEYIQALGNGKVLYAIGGFALPDTGMLPAGGSPATNQKQDHKKHLGLNLGIGARIHRAIVKSVLDGAYRNLLAKTKVLTDPRWDKKFVHQLTEEDRKILHKEIESELKSAKENGFVRYPS